MMKVTVNVECTPEEARVFMGLPDVQPIQDAMMHELQDRMTTNMRAFAPEALFASWMPAGSTNNVEQFQKMFWGQFQSAIETMTNATNTAMLSTQKSIQK